MSSPITIEMEAVDGIPQVVNVLVNGECLPVHEVILTDTAGAMPMLQLKINMRHVDLLFSDVKKDTEE